MNSNWTNTTIGDFIELQRGYDLTEEERMPGDIPVFGAAGLNGFHSIAKSKGIGVIVGRSGGSFGQVHLCERDFWPHNTAMFVSDFKGNDRLFTFYLLKSIDFSRYNSGSAQPSLNRNYIYPIPIRVPQPHEQKKISDVLWKIDSKISLNNRINTELEAMAKTIYDYWFVQFDFPDKTGKPYKASGGKMVWSEELKREIPEGWRSGTLSEISDLVRGVSYSANDIRDKNEQDVVPILRATNISGNVIDLQNMVYVPSEFVSDKQVLDKFDILITMSSGSKDHIGKNGFYYFDEHLAFGAFCAKLVAKANYRYYLYSYTQSDFMFATIKNESLGTNINNLNGTMVAGFKLPIPPKELIEKFNLKVESVFEKIGLNIRENQKLTELRDWLLPLLMNGQIKIKDAERELAMAAEPEIKYRK